MSAEEAFASPPIWHSLFSDEEHTEDEIIQHLAKACRLTEPERLKISADTEQLVNAIRSDPTSKGLIESFIGEYSLSNDEGILLMCLAESLLRIPDAVSREALIREKLLSGHWREHIGHGDSWLVNASTYGLLLGKKMLAPHDDQTPTGRLENLFSRAGEEVIFQAIAHSMGMLADQFVMAETIEAALKKATPWLEQGYRFSFDMLGEAALSSAEAQQYATAYERAIETIASFDPQVTTSPQQLNPNGVSVKLSALHPRLDAGRDEQIMDELLPRLRHICRVAAQHGIPLTIDAEEVHRLEPTMMLFEYLLQDRQLSDWQGLGIALQSYQQHSYHTLATLLKMATRYERRLIVRLVKGAYWDSEIKWAQQQGLTSYPVFTRKRHSDISWLACARFLMDHPEHFYPQFATHNAHSMAAVYTMRGDQPCEMQKLYGMGEGLYQHFLKDERATMPCSIYAPVGSYEQLLPYLVRRLLENGANTSFLHHVYDSQIPPSSLAEDPLTASEDDEPAIELPANVYLPERKNSLGPDLSQKPVRDETSAALVGLQHQSYEAASLVNGKVVMEDRHVTNLNPANTEQRIGITHLCSEQSVKDAIDHASNAYPRWRQVPVSDRADMLNKMAALLHDNQMLLLSLLIREAGKSIVDSLNEIREAIDFCYYYATQATQLDESQLVSVSGEDNRHSYHGRGVFVCISPWNFPLAIYVGQIAAALVCGNTVIAKPASATTLIAWQVARLFHEAGIPTDVLQLLLTSGETLEKYCLTDDRVRGVAFTGSDETARQINCTLAARDAPIATLIAETGGINAMIIDATALLPQSIPDILSSAFNSAGQRCSAARVLFVQEEIADELIHRLRGAMQELTIGDPALFTTDVGPLISQQAMDKLRSHEVRLRQNYTFLHQCTLEQKHEGYFFPPTLYEIPSLKVLTEETFGPILHLVRYPSGSLDKVIDQINDTQFGLTLAIHSRLQSAIDTVIAKARVGNIYVNRNQIGAIVTSQPFGGEGLSGTGPKAGGPDYLRRFMTEHTVSTNTAAIGGNTELLR